MAALGESSVVLGFPEWQVTTFDVNCTGTGVVLAVQKWLAVVGFGSSGTEFGSKEGREKAKRKLGIQNKYEVKAVGWNPHRSKEQLLASTNHQKLEVWDVEQGGRVPLISMKVHGRPVSDLSWSSADANLITTCAADSYVHVWDIRDTIKPQITFRTLGGLNSGASLVQWNRVSSSIIASAHDSDIRIWDLKKPSTVSACISAHMNKIHDLDWSYKNERHLTTCSHDATVKFWDVQSYRESLSTIKARNNPVWRARNYPVGQGIAMALVPTVHAGDKRVFVWSHTNTSQPVCVFSDHSDAVTELHWRRFNGECQLVSLARDKTLRMWKIDDQLQLDLETEQVDAASYINIDSPQTSGPRVMGADVKISPLLLRTDTEKNMTAMASGGSEGKDGGTSAPITSGKYGLSDLKLGSSATMPSKDLSLTMHSPQTPSHITPPSSIFSPSHHDTLAQEFALLNIDIPNLEMERLDSAQRSCTVKMEQGGHLVRIQITFPSHYPNGAVPAFNLESSTTIDISMQLELTRVVSETAYSSVRANRPCLEQCLRRLAKAFESLLSRPEPPSDRLKYDMTFGKLDDDRIPFPRTSGARFCASGFLVCFSHQLCPLATDVPGEQTPRSLDALSQFRSQMKFPGKGQRPRPSTFLSSSSLPKRGSGTSLHSQGSIESPLLTSMDRNTSFGSMRDKTGKRSNIALSAMDSEPMVVIHDSSCLLPVDYNLAKSYKLNCASIQDLCSVNASVAAAYDRQDLVHTWRTTALIADNRMGVPSEPDRGMPWAMHPFGRQLVHSLFSHYAALHDVQTLAMLACVFQRQHDYIAFCVQSNRFSQPVSPGKPNSPIKQPLASSSSFTKQPDSSSISSTHSTHSSTSAVTPGSSGRVRHASGVAHISPLLQRGIQATVAVAGGASVGSQFSDRDQFKDLSNLKAFSSPEVVEIGREVEENHFEDLAQHRHNCSLLDETLSKQCAEYQRCYADILYRWGLLTQRAEVLKHQSILASVQQEFKFSSQCHRCRLAVKGPFCLRCRLFSFSCSVCNLAVRGCSNYCLACGHGGHTSHLMDWFSDHSVCASGCGCHCLESSGWSQG